MGTCYTCAEGEGEGEGEIVPTPPPPEKLPKVPTALVASYCNMRLLAETWVAQHLPARRPWLGRRRRLLRLVRLRQV